MSARVARSLVWLVPALALGVAGVGLVASGCGGSGSSGQSGTQGSIVFSPVTGTVIPATAGPLPTGAQPFSQTFTVTSGGTPPYTFTAIKTPPGLALAPASPQAGLTGTLSAILSGTPSQPGLEEFSVQVEDARQRIFYGSWSIEVALATPSLTVTPATLPAGTRGQPYSQFLSASGGTLPFDWVVTTGPLPPGIVTTPSTGPTFQISGTPTTTGTFSFTVTVTDHSSPSRNAVVNLSLTVN